MDRCYMKEKQMDSLGPLPFARDFICTLNTTCYNRTTINWNGSYENNNFQTFLDNLTSVYNSFIISNTTDTFSWALNNQKQIEKLNYTMNFLMDILNPLAEAIDMASSENSTEAAKGMARLSIYLCGTNESDAKLLTKYIIRVDNQRSKRFTQTCPSKLKKYLSSDRAGTIIYQSLAPILFGKIYYTPNSKFTQELVKRANLSFVILDKLQLASIEWRLHFRFWLERELINSSRSNNLRNQSRDCAQLNISPMSPYCKVIYNSLNKTNIMSMIKTFTTLFAITESVLECIQLDKFVAVETATEIDNLTVTSMSNVFAGLVFDESFKYGTLKNTTLLNYTIRMPTYRIYSTTNFIVLDKFWIPAPRRFTMTDLKYYTSGFLMLQEAVDRGFIEMVSGNASVNIGSSMQLMPSPCYVEDGFIRFAANLLPFIILIAWSPSFSILVKSIVYEKEKRLKEYMLIMGLSHSVLWLTWFTVSICVTIVPVVVTAIVLRYNLVFAFSSSGVTFLLFFSYTVSFTCQAFMFSVFFRNANIAAVVSGLLYFICYIPHLVIVNMESSISFAAYLMTGIIAQVSFCNSLNLIANLEQTTEGAQFDNLLQSTVVNLEFGLGHCIAVLWIDAVIYLGCAMYVEAVWPGQYGIPRPWYFLVTRNFWCPNMSYFHSNNTSSTDLSYENPLTCHDGELPANEVESTSAKLKVGISVRNLTKSFSKTGVPVVDNLNLDFYQSHITAFLGHNGAGKTTTISMLTGIFPPTSGTAYIYNEDIRTNIAGVRKILGLCPQHNILFDNLTVADHVYFYGQLRGMSSAMIELTLPTIVEDVGLTKKINTKAKNLSGGMKRKLSVAMAFIGDSKAIFLDEPTAGVDPFARRGIWDLLIKYRGSDKTIILTTHHMDEADYLSDRIAIISQGKMKCCGSSMFLKRQFGDGYYLLLVKSTGAQQEDFNEIERSVSGKSVLNFIQRHLPDATFFEESRTQWTIILPFDGQRENQFSDLFQSLDEALDALNISSYGISDTSLEDVFLKVADDPSKSDESQTESVSSADIFDNLTDGGDLPRPKTRSSFRNRSDIYKAPQRESNQEESSLNCVLISGFALLRQQVLALQIKKLHYSKRNVKGVFCELILPVFMVIGIVGLLTMIKPPDSNPPMIIHPWLMLPKARRYNLNTFYRQEKVANSQVSALTSAYRTDLGESGVRCMNRAVYSLPDLVCYPTFRNVWSKRPNGIIPLESPSCDCNKTGFQLCTDPLSGGPPNSLRRMASSDVLSNLTGYNISDYLIKNYKVLSKNQFGGYQFLLPSTFGLTCNDIGRSEIWNGVRSSVRRSEPNVTDPQPIYFVNYFQEFFRLSGIRTNFTRIWINNKGYAAMPAYANIFDNLLLRTMLNSSVDRSKYGIVVSSFPFRYVYTDMMAFISAKIALEMSLSIFIIISLSLIPASFVIFLIEERVTGSKRLQFVSGVTPYVYWISNFLGDIVKYLISAVLIVLVFLAFNEQVYVSSKNVNVFILLLCLYGFTIIPNMYPLSFVLSTPSTAFVILSVYNVFVGALTTMSTYFLDGMQSRNRNLEVVNDMLKNIFLIFPQYSLGRGMMDLCAMYLQYNVTQGSKNYDPYSWEITGKKLTSLGILFVFWWSVIFVIETGIIDKTLCGIIRNHNLKKRELITAEDSDVTSERERVETEASRDDILKVINLTKVYNPTLKCSCKCCRKSLRDLANGEKRKLAVNNISFGVKSGECFGLLGVNGAGKTTTFKMLTGEEPITRGEATINGKSLSRDMVAAHKSMGFCPQIDALHAVLTCEEELYFYCRIRGIEPSAIKTTVELSLQNLSLSPHASKRTHSLSGGNKRKLSTAISLIGSPNVIFMDEPTSGMDAGARRFLWNRIHQLTNERRAVILTSHNMAECEVLCHRLTIMVDGEMKCVGSVQQLKSKFGDDYYMTLRLGSSNEDCVERERVKAIMTDKFGAAVSLKDENFVSIQYRIKPSSHKLYTIFSFLEDLKRAGTILDYSVSQTTLDDIFINFAKKQKSCADHIVPQFVENGCDNRACDESTVTDSSIFTVL